MMQTYGASSKARQLNIADRPKSVQKTASRQITRPLFRMIRLTAILGLLLSLTVCVTTLLAGYALTDKQRLSSFQQPESMPVPGYSSPVPREYIRLSDMPAYVPKAFLAIEDHRFFSHPGVDPIGLGRAVWTDLTAGAKRQGGSTITMQVARNLFLTNEKTYTRKWKEIAIALTLEQKLTKEQILELYLNNIYYGKGAYGIEAAATVYFGKTVRANAPADKRLTLGEAAMLAGLVKAPEAYSSQMNGGSENARMRQQLVLKRMAALGWITAAEQQAARGEQLVHVPETSK